MTQVKLKKPPAVPGSVVVSRAGHDAGRPFIVLAVEPGSSPAEGGTGRERTGFALLADGKTRRAQKPKRKKLCHVHITPFVLADIAQSLADGQMPEDHQLRKALAAHRAPRPNDPKGDPHAQR